MNQPMMASPPMGAAQPDPKQQIMQELQMLKAEAAQAGISPQDLIAMMGSGGPAQPQMQGGGDPRMMAQQLMGR